MRFGLRTLLIFVTIAALVCTAPIVWKQIQLLRFKSYVDRDLQSIGGSELQQLNSLRKSCFGSSWRHNTFGWGQTPRFLWQHPNGNLIFLEASHIMSMPGQSLATITVIADSGKLVNQTEFSTGWGISVVNAERIDPESTTEFLFVINSQPVIMGRDVGKQYYAIIDDHPFLLRLEDSAGNTLSNGVENQMIGPELPEKYDTTLIDSLKSTLATKIQNAR